MTSRERIACAFRGGTPDRVPVSPFGMGRISPDSELGREMIAKTDPLIDVWCGDALIGANLGNTVTEATDADGVTTTITIDTPKGPLIQRNRSTSLAHATIEFPLKTGEDVDRFLSLPYAPPEPAMDGFNKWRDRLGEEGMVMAGIGNAVCLPASWFSPEGFCLAWADAPDLVLRLVEVASERLLEFTKRLCRAGVDAFRIVGGEYVSVQLGPSAFARLVTPFDTALVEVIRSHGAIAYYHNHGKVMDYLPALSDLGIDALDPLEAPPWGDVDLKEARARSRPDLCFVGNLDDMEVLDSLPEPEVLAIARECLEKAGRRAFVLGGTASGTYGENAARNFIAMASLNERDA